MAAMTANDDCGIDAADVDATRYHHAVDVVKIVVADDDSTNVVDLIVNGRIVDVVDWLRLASKFFASHSSPRFLRLLLRLCCLTSSIGA